MKKSAHNKFKLRQRALGFLGFGMLALVALCLAVPTFGASMLALLGVAAPKVFFGTVGFAAKCAAFPFVGAVRLLDKAGAEGGESAALDKIEKGVTSLQGDVETLKKNSAEIILADQARWPAQLRTAMEDLTKAKDSINGFDSNFKNFGRKVKELEQLLRNEVRTSFGDPIRRISNNEELRGRFNCAIRLAMDKNGDLRKSLEPQLKALGEDTSPGSTLINTALFREIYDTLAQYGIWNTLGVRRMGTKLTRLPVKTARPVAQWMLTEGGSISDDTNKAGTEVTLEVEVLAVLLNVSLQLLQDSEFDLTADVMDDFAEAYAYALDYTMFQGDGTADGTNGGMTGLFGFGTAAVAASTHTSVSTLTVDDFVKARNTVDVGILGRPNRWWMHPFILAKVCLIKDLNGRPIFQTALEAPTPTLGSILGAPVVTGAALPSADTASSKVAAYGDPNGYVVGIREDFVFEASDQYKWNALQRSFRGYGRAGGKGRKAGAFAILTNAAS
jgi:HK97 family phage major capsid protein